MHREEEEHLCKEEEERFHKEEESKAKEELERLQREEEEHLRKEEEEKCAKEEAENILKDSLCSFVGSRTKSEPKDLSSEDIFHELLDLRSKRLGIEHADIHLQQSIAKLGALIVDEDVHCALWNLKQLGIEMQKNRRTLFEQKKEESDKIVFGSSGSTANAPVLVTVQIKWEKDVQNGVQTKSSSSLHSPPAQLFHGMKWYNEESFAGTMSQAKRRKTGSIPSHAKTPVSTPNRVPVSTDKCLSQVEIKCKKADQGNNFLRMKKVTKSNNALIFKTVCEKKEILLNSTAVKTLFTKS